MSVDLHAALQAVGRLHRDGADAVLAEVLLDLADDVDRRGAADAGAVDAERVVDRRQVSALELHVDDRADDLDDACLMLVLMRRSPLAMVLCPLSYCACAPDTTSMISRVIAAWRTLFMYSVSLSIMSLRVARRRVHRRHARGVLRRRRLEQRAEDLALHVLRQQLADDRSGDGSYR